MMNIRSFLSRLIKFRAAMGVASIAIIVLYLVYLGILRLGIISTLGAEASFNILTRIINFTFILAITVFILSIISYTLHKVLPASFFEPIPKIEYAIAIAKMFDPYDVNPLAQINDRLELYPGFPYYSRESDHPTLWPLRVNRDRQALFLEYDTFLSRYPVVKALEASHGNKGIQVFGKGFSASERDKIETIANLRAWFNDTLHGDHRAVEEHLGAEAAATFLRIEDTRSELRRHFPNRIALARIKNAGKRDARDVTIEFDLFGELYDVAINADPDRVRRAEYDRAKKHIVIEQILPGSQVEIRLWYQYYSVENKVFPDERDFILELTQGIVINNVAVSEGIAALNEKLMDGFSAYELLYIGAAAKKDDYSDELAKYFEEQGKRLEAHMKNYDEEHPSLKDVSSKQLAASNRPDESVNAIWVRFDSKAGMAYKAVHVFHHPEGPYILLSSTDRDREDFLRVEAALSNAYQGTAKGQISDRGDDICDIVSVANGFTQKGVAEQVDTFFQNNFDRVAIEAVHY